MSPMMSPEKPMTLRHVPPYLFRQQLLVDSPLSSADCLPPPSCGARGGSCGCAWSVPVRPAQDGTGAASRYHVGAQRAPLQVISALRAIALSTHDQGTLTVL